MELFTNLLTGGGKRWRVGEHRVKKIRVTPPGRRSNKIAFECVDCERRCRTRASFRDVDCYEVIE